MKNLTSRHYRALGRKGLAFLSLVSLVLTGFTLEVKAKPVVTDKVFADIRADRTHPQIDTNIPLSQVKYKLVAPAKILPDQRYGLVVYISPTGDGTPPASWYPVLAQKNLLAIGPMGAGNEVDVRRRMGLGLLGALAMQRDYNIDPSRIYVAGFSGGARVASALGFFRPDLFSGTIQSVGSNYPKKLPSAAGTDNYGEMTGGEQVNRASVRDRVRFVIITSPTDFRYNNLKAMYTDGFQADGFQAKFIDVPGMGHQVCGAKQLREALTFIEGR